MPINGLTNTPKAFIKLGHIRKGEKVKTADGHGEKPVDLDHFRITFQPGVQMEAVQKAVKEAYGDRPTEINVRFASNVLSEVWDANYECYKQGGLIAKAGENENGLYWIFYRDPDTSEVLVRNGSPVGEEGREFFEKTIDLTAPIYKNSKNEGVLMEPVGRLQVVIPEVAPVAVGYFLFQPGSPRDIRNISAELGAYAAMAATYGKTISGIPFVLRRREEEVTKNINGKLSKGKSWVVHLDAGGKWGSKAIEMIERLALPDIVDSDEVLVQEGEVSPDPAPTQPKPAAPSKALPRESASTTPDQQIDPLSKDAVEWAAAQWNVPAKQAAEQIGKSAKFTNPMSKAAFKKIVLEG